MQHTQGPQEVWVLQGLQGQQALRVVQHTQEPQGVWGLLGQKVKWGHVE